MQNILAMTLNGWLSSAPPTIILSSQGIGSGICANITLVDKEGCEYPLSRSINLKRYFVEIKWGNCLKI